MEQRKRRIRRTGRGFVSLLLALALCLGLRVPALAEENTVKQMLETQVSVTRDGFYNEWRKPFAYPDYVCVEDNTGQTFFAPCSSYAYSDKWELKNICETDEAFAIELIVFRKNQNAYRKADNYSLYENDGKFQWHRVAEGETVSPCYFTPGDRTFLQARTMVNMLSRNRSALDDDAKAQISTHDYVVALVLLMTPFTRNDSDPNKLKLDLNDTSQGLFFFQYDEEQADKVLSHRLTDVAEDSYCYKPVLWALRTSVTKGTTDTTFSPDNTCTRAQILTFIWRYSGEPEPTIPNPYTDVTEDAYYYKAALWAYEKGMVTGTEFNGSTPCTRASTMEYLWKLRGSPKTDGAASFEDVPAGTGYAEAVAWAVKEGITNGVTDTTFAPERTCTRGNIVTFLNRYSSREVIWDTLRQMNEIIEKGTSEQTPTTEENPENASTDENPENTPPDGIPEGAPTDESPENTLPEL